MITAPTSKYASVLTVPSSTTADHDQAANVPIEMSVSIVTAPWRALRAAARWNGQPPHHTTGVESASASHSQPSTCSGGTMARTTSGALRVAATTRRTSSGRVDDASARSPPSAAW